MNSIMTQKAAEVGNILRAKGSALFFRGKAVWPKANKASLIARNKMWAYTFAHKNAVAVAGVPLRLYARRRPNEPAFKSALKCGPVDERTMHDLMTRKDLRYKTAGANDIVEIYEHPFLDLWRNVNSWMDGFEMEELITIFQELSGDAYLWMEKQGTTGLPTSLIILEPQKTVIVPGKSQLIDGYLYGEKPRQTALTFDEVVHFKYPNPNSPYYGMSPLMATVRSHDMLDAIEDYQKTLLDNDARPDFLINYKKRRITDSVRRQLSREWYKILSKKGRGKPFIGDGEVEIKEIGFPPREMGCIELANWELKTLASAFDMPESFYAKSAARAISFEDTRRYMKFAILPRLIRQEQVLNAQIISLYDDRLFCAYENPVPHDMEQNIRKAKVMLLSSKVFRKNEIRDTLQMPALEDAEGGDELYEATKKVTTDRNADPKDPAGDENARDKKSMRVGMWDDPKSLGGFTDTVGRHIDDLEAEVLDELG